MKDDMVVQFRGGNELREIPSVGDGIVEWSRLDKTNQKPFNFDSL